MTWASSDKFKGDVRTREKMLRIVWADEDDARNLRAYALSMTVILREFRRSPSVNRRLALVRALDRILRPGIGGMGRPQLAQPESPYNFNWELVRSTLAGDHLESSKAKRSDRSHRAQQTGKTIGRYLGESTGLGASRALLSVTIHPKGDAANAALHDPRAIAALDALVLRCNERFDHSPDRDQLSRLELPEERMAFLRGVAREAHFNPDALGLPGA